MPSGFTQASECLRVLALVIVCLTLAATARAEETEIGPHFAFPLPAGDVGNTELGANVGVVFTRMRNPWFGIGLDFGYHYLPASAEFKTAFDRHLRRNTFLQVTDPTWAFSAVQAGGHVKAAAPLPGRITPWARVGLAIYRVDWNLKPLRNATVESGHNGSIGIDVEPRPGSRVGVVASYHHLWSEAGLGSEFTAYTFGTQFVYTW